MADQYEFHLHDVLNGKKCFWGEWNGFLSGRVVQRLSKRICGQHCDGSTGCKVGGFLAIYLSLNTSGSWLLRVMIICLTAGALWICVCELTALSGIARPFTIPRNLSPQWIARAGSTRTTGANPNLTVPGLTSLTWSIASHDRRTCIV